MDFINNRTGDWWEETTFINTLPRYFGIVSFVGDPPASVFEQHNCSAIKRCTIPGDDKSCTVEEGTGVTRYSECVEHQTNFTSELILALRWTTLTLLANCSSLMTSGKQLDKVENITRIYTGGCYFFNTTTEEWEGKGISVIVFVLFSSTFNVLI